MREIRARFAVPGADLNPLTVAYETGVVSNLQVHRMKVLADGTVMAVLCFTGDPETLRSVLGEDDTVITATVTDAEDGILYAHFEPMSVVRTMIDARRETELAMQMPLWLNEDGSVTGTFYGDEATFSQAMDLLPADVTVALELVREATTATQSVFDGLTERQREVLHVAAEAGYYDDPRGATHAELAEQLGVSPTTVSEHLRRIERRVFATDRDAH